MTSFFANQTFGDDFYRRQGPAGSVILGATSAAVRNAHPISPGANDANGNYVIDTPAITNFVSNLYICCTIFYSSPIQNCDGYFDLATNQLAASLNKTTGILRRNVETMSAAMFKTFHDHAGCTEQGFPS